jgi:hypothetical protein
MSKKYEYEYVKKYIEQLGFILLSKEYTGIRKPLEISCKNGHIQKLSYDTIINRVHHCFLCKKNNEIDKFKKIVEYRKHVMIGNYVNSKTKILLKCDHLHEFNIRPNDFQQGVGCPKCKNKKLSKLKTKTYKEVKEYIENVGYVLLDDNYIGCFEKLHIKCDKGHEFEMKFSNFKNSDQRCPTCYKENKTYTYDYVNLFIKNEGYELLSSEYKNCKTKLNLRCDKGHDYTASFNCFQQGERCPVCFHKKLFSKGEKQVLDFLKKIYFGIIINNDRSFIVNPKTGKYLELDIWLPELNKAIEYYSDWWHRDTYTKEKDFIKIEYCSENNIDLLHINDNIWKRNRKECESNICNFIGV